MVIIDMMKDRISYFSKCIKISRDAHDLIEARKKFLKKQKKMGKLHEDINVTQSYAIKTACIISKGVNHDN